MLVADKKIGEGRQGQVFSMFKCSSKVIVIKVASGKDNIKSLKKEKGIHFLLHEKTGMMCRRFFPKPVHLDEKKTEELHKMFKAPRGDIEFHAMEPVNGVTLESWLRGAKRPNAEIKKVLTSLRRALFCLWSHGFVHGDVTARNVMVTEKLGVKLIDFGFSTFSYQDPRPKYTGPKNLKDPLNPEVIKWFWKVYSPVLKGLGFPKGNPNITAWRDACTDDQCYIGDDPRAITMFKYMKNKMISPANRAPKEKRPARRPKTNSPTKMERIKAKLARAKALAKKRKESREKARKRATAPRSS